MHGDDIAVLDPQIVSNHTVDAGTAIIQIVIRQDDQHSIPALLALDQHRVTTEELQSFHGVVREGNDGVVIVHGIGDAARCQC